MSDLSAVVFVPDDTAKTGSPRPMMLQAIMGTPLLSWLTRSLAAGGVGRFFLVCHERFLSEAKRCFPDGCELSCAKLEETADQLHVFLSTADEQEEDVIVVTGPAVIDPFAVDEAAFSGAPAESGVSSVSRQALMDALDDTFIFTDFMKEHGVPYTDRDGVYAVSSMQQLAEWKPVLSRGVLYDLAAAGVSVWDYDNTYVEPTVFVGASYIDESREFEATFDGRRIGEPFIVHISSDITSNPYTELIQFASKLDYNKASFNGNVIDFMVTPSFIESNKEKFLDFLILSTKVGFFQMQMNVVSSEILIKAKKNPKEFPDLIVRVWGFSAYFNDLPEEYKNLLIERALKSEGIDY